MIEIAGFIDLHTHTRYPDDQKFPFIDIDDSAINGGFSTILSMPNSEIPIDSIKNLKIAEEIDKKLKTKVHRVASCLLYTSPSPRDTRHSRMPSSA